MHATLDASAAQLVHAATGAAYHGWLPVPRPADARPPALLWRLANETDPVLRAALADQARAPAPFSCRPVPARPEYFPDPPRAHSRSPLRAAPAGCREQFHENGCREKLGRVLKTSADAAAWLLSRFSGARAAASF